uniref:Uncharacterized protein n=1 Tax=Anguilla anguilla TaxID=7936 RepID=A0A0E9SE11_ANGAN
MCTTIQIHYLNEWHSV